MEPKTAGMKKKVLVIFKKVLTEKERRNLGFLSHYDTIISPVELKEDALECGCEWVLLDEYVVPGSIYDASSFVDELSRVVLPSGTRVTKSFIYHGYELWWIHYSTLFLNICVPLTQYKTLLAYLTNFSIVDLYETPCNRNVFSAYLTAYGSTVRFINESRPRVLTFFPIGILAQILLTLISFPVLFFERRRVLVFTGDKFARGADYDFRMEFIYKELRRRKISFVESIRSLESWRVVFSHALKRKRAVVYATAVTFLARYISLLTWSHHKLLKQFSPEVFKMVRDPEERFKLILATRYLATVRYDVWEIRLTRLLLKLIGVRAAFVAAANERNFHTVLACKMNSIPTVGILHGSASAHYNVYDFMPSYDAEKTMSVDTYGLWSEWWKEYYSTYSKAYHSEQLFVSGLMRPYDISQSQFTNPLQPHMPVKVLFVSEQLAVPSEVLPYLNELLQRRDMLVYLVFRPYRDGFEMWLKEHCPEILATLGEERILRNGIKEALPVGDIIVGSHSTAVLEALFQKKPMVFFETKKWGDYFNLENFSREYSFYAHSPIELVDLILKSKTIPTKVLEKLQYRFFGDLHQHGSVWVVDKLAAAIKEK